jgi:hypothetical protein
MTTVRINIANITKVLQEEALKTAEQASQIGEQKARQTLDLAVTPYGRKRLAKGRGRSAGRNDTGSMIDNLRALRPVVKAQEVLASFGWGRGRSKRYYKFQEEGTGRIRAANSLLSGRRAIMNELPRLERNMKARIRRRLSK